MWDVDKTVIVKEFSGIEGIPRGLGVIRNEKYYFLAAFIPRERKVITCTEDGKVNLYNWKDAEIVKTVHFSSCILL